MQLWRGQRRGQQSERSARIRPRLMGRCKGGGRCCSLCASPDAGEPAPSTRGPAWLHWSVPLTLQSPARSSRRMGNVVSRHQFLHCTRRGALSAFESLFYTMTRRARWRLLQRASRAEGACWGRDRVAQVPLTAARISLARDISHCACSCLLYRRIRLGRLMGHRKILHSQTSYSEHRSKRPLQSPSPRTRNLSAPLHLVAG